MGRSVHWRQQSSQLQLRQCTGKSITSRNRPSRLFQQRNPSAFRSSTMFSASFSNAAIPLLPNRHQEATSANKSCQNKKDVPQSRQSESVVPGGRGKQKWLSLILGIIAVGVVLSATCSSALAGTSGSEASSSVVSRAVHIILHLDHYLAQIVGKYGKATYAILWGIVFCETGLVITPFLPGDSLLFACGALASLGSLNLAALFAVFISAAIIGDAVNYQLGRMIGSRAQSSRLVKQEYLRKTEKFYAKHGSKTIVLARFIPIVRTFAPFVAGVGSMTYSKFSFYNIAGALLWTFLFVGGGALLGNVPAVKHNFSIVVFAIIGVSLLPVIFEVIQAKRQPQPEESDQGFTTYRFKDTS